MLSRTSYMPQLDVLRAIAIGLVMLEHFGGPLVRRYFPLDPGALGVHLFFILSGFLISGTILVSQNERPDQPVSLLADFYVRRTLRLFPAFYLTLLTLVALGIPSVRDWSAWHAGYLSNYIVIFGGPLVVFWSLAVEEQFYLILPITMILSGRRWALRVGVAFVGLGLICRLSAYGLEIPKAWFEFSLPGKLELLGFGVALGAISYSDGKRDFSWFGGARRRNFCIVAAGTLLFQLAVWSLEDDGPVRFMTFNITSACFLGFLVIWCASGAGGPVKFASKYTAIRFIGTISFGIYLIHAFLPSILQLPPIERLTGKLTLVQTGAVVVCLSFLIPTISWFVLERPALMLARRLPWSASTYAGARPIAA